MRYVIFLTLFLLMYDIIDKNDALCKLYYTSQKVTYV